MDGITSNVESYRDLVEILVVLTASLIALSSVDDFIVDWLYWFRRIADFHTTARHIDLEYLDNRPQSFLAIIVPAWQEFDVIRSMLMANCRLLAYRNYHIFVGAYQNDPATQAEVRSAELESDRIHLIVVPRDGPTSKADCLNEIVLGTLEFEKQHQLKFAGIVLHDAEDLIHPHELALFNAHTEQLDFMQLPVFSFNRPLSDMVGGLYMDEFAEAHLKDIPVRERTSGLVPCAGVAAYFGREVIFQAMGDNGGAMFRTDSLTEDYDIAVRLCLAGARARFIIAPAEYAIDTVGKDGQPSVIRRTLPVATREFFPDRFVTAQRQRARWLLGIVFQGTRAFGWSGSAGVRYFLTRDRKSILTAPLIISGYFVLANLLAIEAYFRWFAPEQTNQYSLLLSAPVQLLLLINFGFLIWRLLHRVYFTTTIYGWQHGLMSVPRLPVANFLNFFAVVRACRLYLAHRLRGTPLVWDKTAHSYPAALTIAYKSKLLEKPPVESGE